MLLLSGGAMIEISGVFMVISEMINANDWNKIINVKLSFLRWFDLINDVYIHHFAH